MGFKLQLLLSICGLAVIGHQITQKILGIPFPFFDNYLDPFCLGVIVTFLLQLQYQYLLDRSNISFLALMVLIAFLSLVSEVLFPYLSEAFTADVFDVFAIGAGSLLAYWLKK